MDSHLPLDGSGRRFRPRNVRSSAAWLSILFLAALAAGWLLERPATAQTSSPPPGDILHIYGVGGALTRDGTLWQYRPEKKEWLTIDEAFQQQGKETRVLPLPVRPDEIREMVTWGFLLTTAGDCWLYDIDRNRWEKLAAPSR